MTAIREVASDFEGVNRVGGALAYAQMVGEDTGASPEVTKRAREDIAALRNGNKPGKAPQSLLSKRVDLGALLRDGIPPVEYMPGELADRMVYEFGVTGFSGHPESGKTSLVCRLGTDAMEAGRYVVYLDFENGETDAARRFRDVGASWELLSDRLVYVPFPGAPDWEQIRAVAAEFPNAVWIWDSTRGILNALGLHEDKASEVVKFMDPLVEFSLTHAVPSLLIDHVTKASTSSAGYSRGSGDKLAAVQAQWYVDCVTPFSQTEVGEIELTRWKARSGMLPYKHRFQVGDGMGNLTFKRLDALEGPEAQTETKIIWYLKGLDEPTSMNDIVQHVGGTATTVRAAVKRLADDEQRPVQAINGGPFVRYAYDGTKDTSNALPVL